MLTCCSCSTGLVSNPARNVASDFEIGNYSAVSSAQRETGRTGMGRKEMCNETLADFPQIIVSASAEIKRPEAFLKTAITLAFYFHRIRQFPNALRIEMRFLMEKNSPRCNCHFSTIIIVRGIFRDDEQIPLVYFSSLIGLSFYI